MSEKKTIRGKTFEEWKEQIDEMSQHQMAALWRNAPIGHPIFQTTSFDGKLFKYFAKRFEEKGGMTVEVSKDVGWES